MCLRTRVKIKLGNRGATMVTVLLGVAFLTILGTILLFMTYTGFQIKSSQSVGENRFYDAEAAMDEIRAGVQSIMSEAIAEAYAGVLKSWDGTINIDQHFIREFERIFLDRGWDTDADGVLDLFLFDYSAKYADFDELIIDINDNGYSGGVTFNPDVLRAFITGAPPETVLAVQLTGGFADYVDIQTQEVWYDAAGNITDVAADIDEIKYTITSISFMGLQLTNTAFNISDGTTIEYVSVVESDLTCVIPDLIWAGDRLSFRDIANFAFIATGEMSSSNTVTINGDVYTGSVNLGTAGDVTLEKGTFISGGTGEMVNGRQVFGNILIAGGHAFNLDPGTTIWARDITVGDSTSRGFMDFKGSTYTAGSLILAGNNSEVTLGGGSSTIQGSFYGFGEGALPGQSDISSSIIVNSRGNRLDLYGLRQLNLAGTSFIDARQRDPVTGNVIGGDEILTGQSMAVKSDQLAYLIPANLLVGMPTNPMIYTGSTLADQPEFTILTETTTLPDGTVINNDTTLWGTDRKLGHYVNLNPQMVQDTDPVTGDPIFDPVTGDPIYVPVPGTYIGIETIDIPIQGSTTQRLFFVFLKFTNFTNIDFEPLTAQEAANNYFRDYFFYNTEDVTRYLDIYLNYYRYLQSGPASLAESSGLVYSGQRTPPTSSFPLDTSLNHQVEYAERFAEQYVNYSHGLKSSTPYNADGSLYTGKPFDFVVKTVIDPTINLTPPHIVEPPAGFYREPNADGSYNSSGDILAYVHHDSTVVDITPGSDFAQCRIIISYGDVHVNTDFTGLILTQGDIIINSNAQSGGEVYLKPAIYAVNAGGNVLGKFLNIRMDGSSGPAGAEGWPFAELVYFENWKKR